MPIPAPIQQAIQAYYAERISDDQLAALEDWLREDEANVRLFAEHGLVEWQMHCEHEKQDAAAILTTLREAEEKAEPDFSLLNRPAPIGSHPDIKEDRISFQEFFSLVGYAAMTGLRSKAGVLGSLAAVLALGVVLYAVIPGQGDTQQVADHAQAKPAKAVATLTNTHNAKWDAQSKPAGDARRGTPLHPGQRLTLTEGFAEITTTLGAVVILEAPATIELIDSDNAIELHSGKLVGLCRTKSSKGFAVITDHARVTDLGTVFGVSHLNNKTVTTVYEGEVTLTPAWQDPSAEPVHLRAGQSRQSTAAVLAQPVDKDTQIRFVRSLEALTPPELLGDAVYETSMPESFAPRKYQNDEIVLFLEREAITLTEDLRVTHDRPGRFEFFQADGPLLPADTSLDCYLIHFEAKQVNGRSNTRRATIRFERPILGIISDDAALDASDRVLGVPVVQYPTAELIRGGHVGSTGAGRGLERALNQTSDIIELSEDRKTLTVTLTSSFAIDQCRVLVEARDTTAP